MFWGLLKKLPGLIIKSVAVFMKEYYLVSNAEDNVNILL